MQDVNISFYLKANRIHIFVDVLRRLGNPSRICFMLDERGEMLLITPYKKKDFKSFSVPSDIYKGMGSMEISSMRLCRIIAGVHHWNLNRSYRVPGRIYTEHNVVIFSLAKAELIDRHTLNQSRR